MVRKRSVQCEPASTDREAPHKVAWLPRLRLIAWFPRFLFRMFQSTASGTNQANRIQPNFSERIRQAHRNPRVANRWPYPGTWMSDGMCRKLEAATDIKYTTRSKHARQPELIRHELTSHSRSSVTKSSGTSSPPSSASISGSGNVRDNRIAVVE